MVLGFKTEINGKLTKFRDKILKHLGDSAIDPFLARIVNPGFMQLVHLSIIDSTPKKLTIRDDPNNRWVPGRKIHFATGVRTKNYNCFAIGECKRVAELDIHFYNENFIFLKVDGEALTHDDMFQLAKDDGFDTLKDFGAFHGISRNGKPLHPQGTHLKKRIIYF